MALNTQKLLPGSGSKTKSALAVIPKVKSSLVSVAKPKKKSTEKDDPLINILKKTILINKNIEKINEQLIKKQNIKRREALLAKRKGEEIRLETSEKKKKKKKKKDAGPGEPSFLQRVKDFLTYTFLGWLFKRTNTLIPKILGVLEGIGKVAETLAEIIGTISDGIITFIDKGYELWDNFKAWKKENIDGTNFEKIFNPLIDNLETFANLTLIAGLIAATSGDGGNNRKRGGGNNRRRGGNTRTRGRGGNTRTRDRGVTGSNTRGRGRGFFGRRPRITGTGRDRLFRNPFRRKPKPTGTRGYRIQQTLDKLNPLRKKAPVTRSRGTRIRVLQDQIKNLNSTIANQAKRISQLTKSGVDVVAKQAPKIASKVKAGADVTFDAVKSAITKGKFAANQLIELAKPIIGKIVSGGKSSLSAARTLARPILAPFKNLVRAIPVVGLLIDFAINTFIFGDSPDKAAFKAIGAAIFGGIGMAAGSVIPAAGNIIGGTLGGILGDQIGGALYDLIMGKGKTEPKKASKLELNQFNKGGTIGKHKNKDKDKNKEIRDYKEPLMPPLMGSLQSEKIFPLAKEKGYQSPQEFLKKSIKTMRKTPYYGHIFNFFGESILGKRLSFRDIDNIGISISSLISKIFKEELEDGKSFYDIIRNLPGLIYKLTHNELLKRNNKIVSDLSIQSNLKKIYDDSLVKEIKDLKEQLRKEKEKGVSAPTSSPDQIKSTSSPDQIKSTYGPGSEETERDTATGVPMSSSSVSGTIEQKKMLDAIAFAEGTTGSYGTVYGGKVIPELAEGKMTIAEVLEMQRTGMYKGESVYPKDRYNSDATGRYQFMSYTLKEEIGIQGISPSELFTPAMQDRIILGRITRMRKVTPELLAQEGMSDKVIDMLAPEFASFPNLFGPDAKGRVGTNTSYYGQGGKSKEAIKNAYGQSQAASLKGGGDAIKTRKPRSFKSLQEKTSYENGIIIMIKREREIVSTPINNQRMSSITVNSGSSTLSPEKFNSFMK